MIETELSDAGRLVGVEADRLVMTAASMLTGEVVGATAATASTRQGVYWRVCRQRRLAWDPRSRPATMSMCLRLADSTSGLRWGGDEDASSGAPGEWQGNRDGDDGLTCVRERAEDLGRRKFKTRREWMLLW